MPVLRRAFRPEGLSIATPVRRLTVVQLLPALDSGGVERSTLEHAAALVRAGHRSIVVSTNDMFGTGNNWRFEERRTSTFYFVRGTVYSWQTSSVADENPEKKCHSPDETNP